jgi:hypothetical protein
MSKKETNEELRLPDEKNPNLIFNLTHSDILIKKAKREINARKLALEQLRNRGLDEEGRWVVFKGRQLSMPRFLARRNKSF